MDRRKDRATALAPIPTTRLKRLSAVGATSGRLTDSVTVIGGSAIPEKRHVELRLAERGAVVQHAVLAERLAVLRHHGDELARPLPQ